MQSRRNVLALAASSCLLLGLPIPARARAWKRSFGFGFSLYGMKNLPLLDALKHCAAVGYDCVELPTMADWPGAPEKLTAEDRKRFRDGLAVHSLRLSALMENVVLLAEPGLHAKNLERLKRAAELGHELTDGALIDGAKAVADEKNPATDRVIIETVMGGKPSEWMEVREAMVGRLREWAEVGKQTQSIVAIKAHISGAAHRPEHIRWLLDQVASPWLKAAFDFSHFQLRNIDLAEAWKMLAADTVFIHVKDSVGTQEKFQFVLPGEGTIDYAEYLKLITESSYTGDIVVEVSGQLHSRPDYDPVAACRRSFAIAELIE